ncbi:MAG TPA: cupin domain-containing protein [Candidatus Acidoferrales bacterium]|nr:cupin domain-containing protein [Candidatus Acidoferrales bacterium]
MRRSAALTIGLLLASCGGAATPAASSPTAAPASPTATPAALATHSPTYSPAAEGFDSKKLVEVKRNLAVSAPGLIWIAPGSSTFGGTVTASVSETAPFTASYQVPVDRQAPGVVNAVFVTPEVPPLPAGLYVESLTLVTVQPGGRSAAHMHSGIEGVLVLEGEVLVRTAGHAPVDLLKGSGFHILPKTPIQLINVGGTLARTIVYSITPDGAPFSTPLDTAP